MSLNKLDPLSWQVPIVTKDGTPTVEFMRKWQAQRDTNDEIPDLTTADAVSKVLDLIGATEGMVLYRDATAWHALAPGTDSYILTAHGATAIPSWSQKEIRLAGSLAGKPTVGQELFFLIMKAGDTFASTLPGSLLSAQVTATSAADLILMKNGTSIGIGHFSAGATVGAWTLAAGFTLAESDKLALYGPSPVDSTLSGLSYTILGNRLK